MKYECYLENTRTCYWKILDTYFGIYLKLQIGTLISLSSRYSDLYTVLKRSHKYWYLEPQASVQNYVRNKRFYRRSHCISSSPSSMILVNINVLPFYFKTRVRVIRIVVGLDLARSTRKNDITFNKHFLYVRNVSEEMGFA